MDNWVIKLGIGLAFSSLAAALGWQYIVGLLLGIVFAVVMTLMEPDKIIFWLQLFETLWPHLSGNDVKGIFKIWRNRHMGR